MIEVVFNEGAAGALQYASSIKQREGAEVFGVVAEIMLALDIGDISETAKRKEVLEVLFSDFPGVADAIWETDQAGLKRHNEAKTTLEPVRMWVCEGNPEELCGMYFVCSLMEGSDTPLSAVIIPAQIEKDGCIVSYRGTEEIGPEEFAAFAAYEQPISDLRRGVYADEWKRLVRDNAALRAIVNGTLMGVSEDFYDFALRANMPDGEFTVAHLIGKTMGSARGVSDRWLFMRVKAMLQSEELKEICAAQADYPYGRVLKRNG